MCQTYYHENICKWFQFNGWNSCYKSVYFSTNYIFLTMFFSFSIPYRHGYSMILKNILPSSSYLFFPTSFSFAFLFFYQFPFVPFFFPNFPLFFLFPNLNHFLNLVCHFLRAPLPCSRTFCCPGGYYEGTLTLLWQRLRGYCAYAEYPHRTLHGTASCSTHSGRLPLQSDPFDWR